MKATGLPNRKKLPKRAQALWSILECQIGCSAGYDKLTGYRKLPLKTVVNGIIAVLAGSKSLDPTLHDQFAQSGYVASREQIEAFDINIKERRHVSPS